MECLETKTQRFKSTVLTDEIFFNFSFDVPINIYDAAECPLRACDELFCNLANGHRKARFFIKVKIQLRIQNKYQCFFIESICPQ